MDILAAALVRAIDEHSRGDIERALAELDAAEQIARRQGRGLPHVLAQRVTWLRELGGAPRAEEAMRAVEAEFSRGPDPSIPTFSRCCAPSRGSSQCAEVSRMWRRPRSSPRGRILHDAGRVSSALALAAINLATIYLKQGRFDEARTLATEAECIDRADGDAAALSNDLNLLGALWTEVGDHRMALQFLDEAFGVARANGLGQQAAEVVENSGIALARLGEHKSAEEAFAAVEAFIAEAGRPHDRAGITVNRAISASRRGDHALARRLLLKASATETPATSHEKQRGLASAERIPVESARSRRRAAWERARRTSGRYRLFANSPALTKSSGCGRTQRLRPDPVRSPFMTATRAARTRSAGCRGA